MKVLAVLVTIYAVCYADPIGTQEAVIDSFPYLASLQAPGYRGRRHICGATILNNRWLVTAARCAEGFNHPRAFNVRPGVTENENGGRDYHVIERIIHPSYAKDAETDNSEFDIALLKVDESIEFNDKTKAIGLNENDDDLPIATNGEFPAWGVAHIDGNQKSILYAIALKTAKNEECETKNNRLKITDSMICTKSVAGVPKNTCYLDSGTPFVVDEKLVAISSKSIGCSLDDKPSAFTRINSDIREWIYNTIQEESASE